MAIPDVDLYLVDIIIELLNGAKGDLAYLIDDVFSLRPDSERASLREYLGGMEITDNVELRDDRKRFLYVIPSHPLMDVPFPQIAVTVPNEQINDFPLGNAPDDTPREVRDSSGEIIGYDVSQSCFAAGQWHIEVVAGTKIETVWLSRLVQVAVLRNLDQMDQIGVKNITLGMMDLQLDPKQLPQLAYARRVQVNGLTVHEWTTRIKPSYYQTGVNLAVEQP